MKRSIYLLPAAVVILIIAFSAIFVVDEREKALVLQFGRVVSVKEDPGLAFKLPLVQEVVFYDDRILSRDIDPLEVTPSDDRRLVVDAFARFRIVDVRQFRQAVGPGGITAAEQRLDLILRSELREVLGSVSSNDILSEDRAALMLRIATGARAEASALGIQIIDVRLKRTDLPPQNLDATFARMRAEREREAADEIARGEEAAQRIRALADRTVIELTSDAGREAEIARGEADARRNNIFAEAFSGDPEFFEFYRSLTAYSRALQSNNSTLVLSPDSEFFDYLKSDGGSGATPQVPADDAIALPEAEEGSSEVEAEPSRTLVPLESAPSDDQPAQDDAPVLEGASIGN
ncbi:protease modulator HflC [Jannaschia rubra]|uniref:Protein HflC n=1 Tax=Jannaschia rubra TaxID=282197 RepID=A0A0M6XKN6_9RHOB|nr:protease modulator HflC [Jannaschia rubra]CTQ31659.1 Modulator of FtsH protease HflC [Jannaschia rubra]SFF75537.1 protease FtsH subunit HflC [Jannaschia rubra]